MKPQTAGERYIECHRTAVSPRATRSPHQARGTLRDQLPVGAPQHTLTPPTGYVWLPQAAAALRAGYTQTRAKQTAYRLLGHPEVSSLVAKLDEAKRDDLGLDAHDVLDRALELYGRAMRGNPRTYRDEVVRDENGDVIYDPNLGAAAKALELIARQLGLLSDRRIVEHGGDVVYTLTLDRELPELEDDTAA